LEKKPLKPRRLSFNGPTLGVENRTAAAAIVINAARKSY